MCVYILDLNLKAMKFIIKEELLSIEQDLYKFALKLMKNNKDDALDLLQESMLKILTNAEQYSVDTNFRAWCYTIIRNTFLNSMRKRDTEMRYMQAKNFAWDFLALQEIIPADADSDAFYKDTCDILQSLPLEYSVPLKMFINGYKYMEISDKLNLPLSTVKNRIHIARTRLRVLLRDYID